MLTYLDHKNIQPCHIAGEQQILLSLAFNNRKK